MSDQDKLDSNSYKPRDRPVSRFNKAEKINGIKNNNSNGMNGMHNNKRIPPNTIPLSRAHQIHIGDPHGKVSIGNPQGYSLNQHKQFNSFQCAEIDNIRNAAIINSNIMGANLPIHNINNNNNNNSNSNNNGNFETWNNVSMQPFNNNNQSNNNMNYNNTYLIIYMNFINRCAIVSILTVWYVFHITVSWYKSHKRISPILYAYTERKHLH